MSKFSVMGHLEGKIWGTTHFQKFDDGVYTNFAVKYGIGRLKFNRIIIKGIHENLIEGRKIHVTLHENKKYGMKIAKAYSLVGRRGCSIYSRPADD